jgi:hypothetical protein
MRVQTARLQQELAVRERHCLQLEQKLILAYESARAATQKAAEYRAVLSHSGALPSVSCRPGCVRLSALRGWAQTLSHRLGTSPSR